MEKFLWFKIGYWEESQTEISPGAAPCAGSVLLEGAFMLSLGDSVFVWLRLLGWCESCQSNSSGLKANAPIAQCDSVSYFFVIS